MMWLNSSHFYCFLISANGRIQIISDPLTMYSINPFLFPHYVHPDQVTIHSEGSIAKKGPVQTKEDQIMACCSLG